MYSSCLKLVDLSNIAKLQIFLDRHLEPHVNQYYFIFILQPHKVSYSHPTHTINVKLRNLCNKPSVGKYYVDCSHEINKL